MIDSNGSFTTSEVLNEIRDCLMRMQNESEELKDLMTIVMKDCLPTWKTIDDELDSLKCYVEDLMDEEDEDA